MPDIVLEDLGSNEVENGNETWPYSNSRNGDAGSIPPLGTNAGLVRFFFIGLVFVTVLLLLCRKENGTVIG